MLPGQVFYNSHIRNIIVAFGTLFSSIKIQRRNNSDVIEQTIQVPIAYSQKEKWIHSIESNPDGTRGVYTALPKLGFEISGYSYDSSRKLQKLNTVYCISPGDVDTAPSRKQVFTPVPWNIDITLYFATKNQEDGLQILEQILPTFSPEYTMSIKTVPELNIVQDVPFILNSVSVQDDYEGDMATRRFVVHTLSFTAKVNLFNGMGNVGAITQVEANFATADIANPDVSYIASQPTPSDPIVETWIDNF